MLTQSEDVAWRATINSSDVIFKGAKSGTFKIKYFHLKKIHRVICLLKANGQTVIVTKNVKPRLLKSIFQNIHASVRIYQIYT